MSDKLDFLEKNELLAKASEECIEKSDALRMTVDVANRLNEALKKIEELKEETQAQFLRIDQLETENKALEEQNNDLADALIAAHTEPDDEQEKIRSGLYRRH